MKLEQTIKKYRQHKWELIILFFLIGFNISQIAKDLFLEDRLLINGIINLIGLIGCAGLLWMSCFRRKE
jgi:hypothetical protein